MIIVSTGPAVTALVADPLTLLADEGVSVRLKELVAPGTVSAMTGVTLDAVAERGVVRGNTVNGGYTQARADLAAVEALGVCDEEAVELLETRVSPRSGRRGRTCRTWWRSR